jgi:hypothetical protein
MTFLLHVKDLLCKFGFHIWKVTGDCHGYGVEEECRHCETTRSETFIGN